MCQFWPARRRPPPASGRRAIDRVGHSQPSSGSRVNEPAFASVVSSIFCARAVETGSRPGRAVLDEAVAGIVVARHDALPGVQASGRRPGWAHSRTAPAFAWIVPVIDTWGRVTPDRTRVELDVDPPDRRGRAEIDRRRARVHLESEVSDESRRDRSTVACPAFSWTSRSEVDGLGHGDPPRVPLAEGPERRSRWSCDRMPDAQGRVGGLDGRARRPSASSPSTRQPSPGAAATVTLPQSIWTSIEPLLARRSRRVPGTRSSPRSAARACRERSPIPLLSRPPTIRPKVAATMSPPRKSKRVRREDESDPDPDQDERPQRPQPADLVLRRDSRRERPAGSRRPGSGRRPSPRKPRPDVHGSYGTRRVVATPPCRMSRSAVTAVC